MQVLVGVPVAYGRGRVGILLEVAVQWSKIGRALTGVAEQLGIEVPGVDVGPVTDAVGGVAEAASGAGSEVTSAAQGVLDGVTQPVTDAVGGVAEAASGASSEATSAAQGVLDGVTQPAAEAIATATENVTGQVWP